MLRGGMRNQFGSTLMSAAMLAALAAVTMLVGISAAIPAMAQAPKGWKLRVDGGSNASDPDGAGQIKFVEEKGGFHATNPQAAAYWNPANTITGNYSLKGTFSVLRPTSHAEYFGLIFGGSGLDGAKQNYLYFMVAGNGRWLFKRRVGDDTEEIGGPEPNKAVKTPDASGKYTNALEVRVLADKIECVINGTVVHTAPKTGEAAKTDGIYGFRVNHLLDVQVDGFAMSKL
jgi:hypothetical protein